MTKRDTVMRARRQSKRGRSARSREDAGEDLFSQTLAGAVKQAFAGAGETSEGKAAGNPMADDKAPAVLDKPEIDAAEVSRPEPETRNPKPETSATENPKRETRNPKPVPMRPGPRGVNPKLETRNPKLDMIPSPPGC